MSDKSSEARQFFYRHFGQMAAERCGLPMATFAPSADACSGCGKGNTSLYGAEGGYHRFCAVCITIAGRYDGIKAPGRLGEGWFAVVSEGKADLTTGNTANSGAFSGLPHVTVRVSTVFEALIGTLKSPPEPPFLLVRFGNSSPATCANMRISHDLSTVYIGGVQLDTVSLDTLRTCAADVSAMGMTAEDLTDCLRHFPVLARHLASAKEKDKADAVFSAMQDKYGDIERLLQHLPVPGTTEYGWVWRFCHGG